MRAVKAMTEQEFDPVKALFERTRNTSKNPPKLNKPAPKMNLAATSNDQQTKPFRRGRPSGPDGRRRRRSLEIPSLGAQIQREIGKRGWEHELAHGWVMGNWENCP